MRATEYKRHPIHKGYFISDEGEVFSISKGWNIKEKQINRNGYVSVSLWTNGKETRASVHRLVAETFYGSSDLQVNHKDQNKENNNLDNLEFCTMSYNIRHRNFGKKRFVTKQTTTGKFQIRIKLDNKYLYTPGQFVTKEEAYEEARNIYFNYFGVFPW